MSDKIPRSAIDSAVHEENQAAKAPEPKGILEELRALWGVSADSLAARGVQFLGEQVGNIGAALEHMGKDALAGIQTEAHTMFYGKRDFGHTHEPPPSSIHGIEPTTVSLVEAPRESYEDIMRAQAEMAPGRDETGPEHDQGPDR